MNKASEILSDIVVFSKYARYIPEIKRRETWEEIVTRNMAMHIRKFPQLKDEIRDVYSRSVLTKKVLPYGGGTYPQMPFEDITKEKYDELVNLVTSIDLTGVTEDEDNTDLTG